MKQFIWELPDSGDVVVRLETPADWSWDASPETDYDSGHVGKFLSTPSQDGPPFASIVLDSSLTSATLDTINHTYETCLAFPDTWRDCQQWRGEVGGSPAIFQSLVWLDGDDRELTAYIEWSDGFSWKVSCTSSESDPAQRDVCEALIQSVRTTLPDGSTPEASFPEPTRIEPTEPPEPPQSVKTPTFPNVGAETSEFVVACAELRNDPLAEMEDTFEIWVGLIEELAPPEEFRDFWRSYVDRFALQLTAGLGEETEAAEVHYEAAIAEMSPDVIQAMVDSGCLDEWEPDSARARAAARKRLETRLEHRMADYEEYASVCADILLTAPLITDELGAPRYFLQQWKRIIPPPGAKRFHSTVRDLYATWVSTGDVEAAIAAEGRRMLAHADTIGDEFAASMQESGCLGE